MDDVGAVDAASDLISDLGEPVDTFKEDLAGNDTALHDTTPSPTDTLSDGQGTDAVMDTPHLDVTTQEDLLVPEEDTASGPNPDPFQYSTTCFLPDEPQGQGGVTLV